MTATDDAAQKIARLRERMARLSSASLRISESLDLESVLREVVDSARVLTGAANAAITTVDRVERVRDFISSGLTAEERRQLRNLPQGERLWGYLLQSTRPLRVDDLASHLDGLGIATAPILRRSFLGAPIRHRGVNVGHFYLTSKEGDQGFTEEDEETLVLFASQAATAIANAQAYRDERRARADLEALVDTSPRRRCRVRRQDRRSRAVQSRGTADGCGPGPVGPLASGGGADDDGPAPRRRGVVVRGDPARHGRSAMRRPCVPRSTCSRCRVAGA